MRKLAYLFAYIIPVLFVLGVTRGGYYHLIVPAFVFGMIPLLDLMGGNDTTNYSPSIYQKLKQSPYYRYITYVYVPCQFALIIWGAFLVASPGVSLFEKTALTLATGIVTGGMGITLAHELGHRTNRFEQFLSKALLMGVCYMHFFIEHNQGHHRHVATPQDPATARFGESFYRFYPRTVVGSFTSAWRLESRRLERRRLPIWSPHNRMIHFVLLPLLFTLTLAVFMGPPAALFFLAQSVVAFSLLEIINYVEHYGLQRRETSPGQYEKVTPFHSWNAAQRVTGFLLFGLQRHSDHHANPNRRYQTLRHVPESPQLPTGYAGMVLLALIPPLWFKVMNPRARAADAFGMST